VLYTQAKGSPPQPVPSAMCRSPRSDFALAIRPRCFRAWDTLRGSYGSTASLPCVKAALAAQAARENGRRYVLLVPLIIEVNDSACRHTVIVPPITGNMGGLALSDYRPYVPLWAARSRGDESVSLG
jgi:hypothetical protein